MQEGAAMEQASHSGVERSKNSLSIAPVEALKQPLPPAQPPIPRVTAAPLGGQSCIGKELTVVGTITGTANLESLFIDGCVEGGVELPGSRVTVGANGRVKAGIVAGDIVVLGEVLGDLAAAHRIEIRAKAAVIGNACAPRISIEDGAYFQGRVRADVATDPLMTTAEAAPAPELTRPALTERSLPQRIPLNGRKPRAQSALLTG